MTLGFLVPHIQGSNPPLEGCGVGVFQVFSGLFGPVDQPGVGDGDSRLFGKEGDDFDIFGAEDVGEGRLDVKCAEDGVLPQEGGGDDRTDPDVGKHRCAPLPALVVIDQNGLFPLDRTAADALPRRQDAVDVRFENPAGNDHLQTVGNGQVKSSHFGPDQPACTDDDRAKESVDVVMPGKVDTGLMKGEEGSDAFGVGLDRFGVCDRQGDVPRQGHGALHVAFRTRSSVTEFEKCSAQGLPVSDQRHAHDERTGSRRFFEGHARGIARNGPVGGDDGPDGIGPRFKAGSGQSAHIGLPEDDGMLSRRAAVPQGDVASGGAEAPAELGRDDGDDFGQTDGFQRRLVDLVEERDFPKVGRAALLGNQFFQGVGEIIAEIFEEFSFGGGKNPAAGGVDYEDPEDRMGSNQGNGESRSLGEDDSYGATGTWIGIFAAFNRKGLPGFQRSLDAVRQERCCIIPRGRLFRRQGTSRLRNNRNFVGTLLEESDPHAGIVSMFDEDRTHGVEHSIPVVITKNDPVDPG